MSMRAEDSGNDVMLELALDMEFSDIKSHGTDTGISFEDAILDFKEAVACDVAHAVSGRRDRVHVTGLRAGSIIVLILLQQGICGRDRSPLEVAYLLQEQALDLDSQLKQGVYTYSTRSVQIMDTVQQPGRSTGFDRKREVEPRGGRNVTRREIRGDAGESMSSTSRGSRSSSFSQQQGSEKARDMSVLPSTPSTSRTQGKAWDSPDEGKSKDVVPHTAYCLLDMQTFPRLHGWLMMSLVSNDARKEARNSNEYLITTGSSISKDPAVEAKKSKKKLWDKIRTKVVGKKRSKQTNLRSSAYQKFYFEIDPFRFRLAWCKDIQHSDEDKESMNLSLCSVTECSFELVKRQFVFEILETLDDRNRRMYIAASDIEEFEIWHATLKV